MTHDFVRFDFSQIGFLYLLVGVLLVLREKRVLPFVAAAVGALLGGWLGIFGLIGVTLVERLSAGRPKWLVLLHGAAYSSFFMAWYAPEEIKSYFLMMGVVWTAVHFRFGGMGVLIPLLLAHQAITDFDQHEVTLGAAAFYLILEELLRLGKVKSIETMMRSVEVPVALAALFPFLPMVLGLSVEPEYLVTFSGLLGLSLLFAAVAFFKGITFERWSQAVISRGSWIHKKIHSQGRETQPWVQSSQTATLTDGQVVAAAFWSVLLIALVWVFVFFVFGGVNP